MKIDGNELDRKCLKEALRLVSKELKKKKRNEYNLRKNRVHITCGSREPQLGRFNRHQSHNYSTSCNMLLNELRTCIGFGFWSAAATLITFLLKMNGTLMPVIWRASLVVLLYHENASHQQLNDFLEQCLGLRSVVEKRSFLHNIFSIDSCDRLNDKGQTGEESTLLNVYRSKLNWSKIELEVPEYDFKL